MDNLKLHIQIVHLLIQTKPFICEYCSQAFQSFHSDLVTYVRHSCTMTWRPIPYKSEFDQKHMYRNYFLYLYELLQYDPSEGSPISPCNTIVHI